MNVIRRWISKGKRIVDALTGSREAKIYVREIEFSSGQKIVLTEGSILAIVGPNNAGKSSVLREIRDRLNEGTRPGPVLRHIDTRVRGTVEAFKKQVMEAGLSTGRLGVIKIGYSDYAVSNVDKEIKEGFIGSKIIPLFVSYLGAGERLDLTEPTSRGEYLRSAPKNPLQWLELDDVAERRISEIFERTFDAKLVLNTFAGDKLILHVAPLAAPSEKLDGARDQARWLASLPRLHAQGDGMRSFAGTLMGLLVHPTSAILLDEPEAFLHPPQARKLAEVIAAEVPGECQVIIATHNDAFVRALLDSSGERVILARIVRENNVNKITVLDQSQLEEIWNDPLLKTSDILSALFHEAAILCEGDSDVRFFSAIFDATRSKKRDPDIRFYHLGGKDRIAGIARALRSINIPVVVIADIDILSERAKFFELFEALGGNRAVLEDDVSKLIRHVSERKGQLTGTELAVELRRLAAESEGTLEVSKKIRDNVSALVRNSSNWQRVKHDGYRALDGQTYRRLDEACKAVGLLINPEGELEGFCRTIQRARKSEWLAEVVQKDFSSAPELADARSFAQAIRTTTHHVISRY